MKPLAPERTALLKAAEHMRKHGHCKEQFSDDRGRVCLIGAILGADANLDNLTFSHAELLLADYLSAKFGAGNFATWNDAPERTKEEAVAALEMAALHGL